MDLNEIEGTQKEKTSKRNVAIENLPNKLVYSKEYKHSPITTSTLEKYVEQSGIHHLDTYMKNI